MFLLLTLAGYFTLKGINNAKGGLTPPSPDQASAVARNAISISGSAPDNGQSASPSGAMLTGESYDDDDDGSMSDTVAMTDQASGDSMDGVDINQTQANSGSNTAVTAAWHPPVAMKGYNRVLDRVWDDVLDVDYISPSPEVQFRFNPPPSFRQDNKSRFNNQPWARSMAFQGSDPTAHFETDEDNPMVPAYSEDEDE